MRTYRGIFWWAMRPSQKARTAAASSGDRARAQADPGHQLLAVALVGHADDGDVLDVGVAVEELLDLARVDVLAAPDDQVLDAADDVDVAVLAA